jgi:hypothetical protein
MVVGEKDSEQREERFFARYCKNLRSFWDQGDRGRERRRWERQRGRRSESDRREGVTKNEAAFDVVSGECE